jgi:hypothetical protein
MQLPKFLMGDHADHMDDIFIIHTEFPHFILNLVTDEIVWMEDIADEDEETLMAEMSILIEQAEAFYDEQIEKYESQ